MDKSLKAYYDLSDSVEPSFDLLKWLSERLGRDIKKELQQIKERKNLSSQRQSEKLWQKVAISNNQFKQRDRSELAALLYYYRHHPIVKGKRDSELIQLCAKCRQVDYDENKTFNILCKINRKYVLPPYIEVGIGVKDKTIEEIVQYVYERQIYPTAPDRWETLQRALEKKSFNTNVVGKTERERQLDECTPAAEKSGIKVYTAVEMAKIAEMLNPPVPILQWLCWQETITIISGDGGVGKSTLLRRLVANSAKEGTKTVWLTNEAEPQSISWWNKVDGINENIFIFDTRYCYTDINADEKWDALQDVIEQIKPQVVVVDTLLSMLHWLECIPDDNETAAWQALVRRLGWLGTRIKAGVVILHHGNKQGKFTGSMGIRNGCDEMYYMQYVTNNLDNKRLLKIDKSRQGNRPLLLDCNPMDYTYWEADGKKTSLSPIKIELLQLFKKHNLMLSPTEIKKSGIVFSTASKYLKEWGISYDKKQKCYYMPQHVLDSLLETGQPPESTENYINDRTI